MNRVSARSFFENARHRDICTMPPVKHAIRLINAEIDHKAQQFRDLAEELKTARTRMTRAEGCPVVLDTNLLLQATRPDGIPWDSVVGEPQVRLLIPLRVIEELDAKKYDPKEWLRRVAREVLPWLEGLFSNSEVGPVALPDPEQHNRRGTPGQCSPSAPIRC